MRERIRDIERLHHINECIDNVLVHGYYSASPLFIWETYTKDLLLLKETISRYIEEQ